MYQPLSITTDFMGGTGDPREALELIAAAGFTHVHWCHRWTGLYAYSSKEIEYIRGLTDNLGLRVLDLHATDGGLREDFPWISTYKYECEFGMELILNRMEMAHRLGAGAIVLHAPVEPTGADEALSFWRVIRANLTRMEDWATRLGVRVAFENTDTFPSNVPTLLSILEMCDPRWIGVCFDSGHANIHPENEFLSRADVRRRLFALHINDNRGNDGSNDPDVHMVPFDGTVAWGAVINKIGHSSYLGPISLEVGRSQYRNLDPEAYLALAYKRGMFLVRMHQDVRSTRH